MVDTIEQRNGCMVQRTIRFISLILMTFTAAGALHAGDVARFVNLGFSPDSEIFMFAQHGINRTNSRPYAEIFTVDVPDNVFVRSGLAAREYDVVLSPGQDGSGALYNLLPDLRQTVGSYHVDHLIQGRPVYILVNGQEPRERLEFRDFDTQSRYGITLTQESRGTGEAGSAAFYLDVTTEFADGTVAEHRVGRPAHFRDGVNRYQINQVIVAPDERSLVVVVERITETSAGRRVRYMVETVRMR